MAVSGDAKKDTFIFLKKQNNQNAGKRLKKR
jgi:hypothetical protein